MKRNIELKKHLTDRVRADWKLSDPGYKVRTEWIRLPREGALCPHSALTRKLIMDLILPRSSNKNQPPVKSVLLRKPGAGRGSRLVHLPSLLSYLAREAKKQASLKTAA